jgi:SAM-dependent methyltransferase
MMAAEAIRVIRSDPAFEDLVRDSYLDADVHAAALRFAESAEFAETCLALGTNLRGAVVLDVGAGTGVASLGFAKAGARRVIALEPDASEEAGRGAQSRLITQSEIAFVPIGGTAECMPLAREVIDIVYARQTLHHFSELSKGVQECARVLRRGGTFMACREHVTDDDVQLRQFLDAHPVHRLTGDEKAWPLATYIKAIEGAGLRMERVLGPWDSVINAYPAARQRADLQEVPLRAVRKRLGAFAPVLTIVPGVSWLAETLMRRRRVPGRLYSFLAVKP